MSVVHVGLHHEASSEDKKAKEWIDSHSVDGKGGKHNGLGLDAKLKKTKESVVVVHWSMCGHCKHFLPKILYKVMHNRGVPVYIIEQEDYNGTYDGDILPKEVNAFPRTFVVKDGKVVAEKEGDMELSDLERLVG
jgi:hypothetical protein